MGIEHGNLNTILLIGLAILGGTAGAMLIQLLRIPRIIGYIAIGVILGPMLGIISPAAVEALEPFNLFALGVIGFLIGGELKREVFVKFGRAVAAILLFEGMTAFLLVGVGSFLVMWSFLDWQNALAVGVVFGAICSATDPASTVDILWEYKTRGPLTTMLTAIVALDDALALVLYIASVSLATLLTGSREAHIVSMILHAVYEVGGSFALGAAGGFALRGIISRVNDDDKTLVFTVGVIVLTIGLATALGLDVILAAMACGVTLVNSLPRRSLKSFEIIRRFSSPVYVVFFVLVGTRLNVRVNAQVLVLAAAYVVGSTVGKSTGSYCGATYAKAVGTVRKYLGFCLYQQGTVAIALLIMASHRFEGQIRDMMLSVIILGVFILQFIGPIFTRIAVKRAGEAGLNITAEDLIAAYRVADVMDRTAPVISAGTSLSEVIRTVGSTSGAYYPVVDNEKTVTGAITLDGLRNTFATQELNDWLVALDIAEPVIATAVPALSLSEAFEQARQLDVEHLPVTVSPQDNHLVGLLDCRAVRRRITAEVLARQQKADRMYDPHPV